MNNIVNFKGKTPEDSKQEAARNNQRVNLAGTTNVQSKATCRGIGTKIKKRVSAINTKRIDKSLEKALLYLDNQAMRIGKFLGKTLRNMLFWIVALLVLQHFVPEVSEKLPSLYGFLNEIMIPIVEWCYEVVRNLLHGFANLPIIRDIIEFLKALA